MTEERADQSGVWKTGITRLQENEILLRGYRIEALMGRVPFADVAYLTLTGELPTLSQGKLIDAILVACIDHGVTPPSSLNARHAASTGAPINAAAAAGLLAINRSHGGSAEEAMRFFLEGEHWRAGAGLSFAEIADRLVRAEIDGERRIPGFGHRLHADDPRSVRLLELAREAKVAGSYVALAQALEASLQKLSKKHLPLNVDGAIAAILCDLGVEVEVASAFFMLARLPGMIAHAVEEQRRFPPMRGIDPKRHEYDGPPERPLPERGDR
jgi:citrate synthase